MQDPINIKLGPMLLETSLQYYVLRYKRLFINPLKLEVFLKNVKFRCLPHSLSNVFPVQRPAGLLVDGNNRC